LRSTFGYTSLITATLHSSPSVPVIHCIIALRISSIFAASVLVMFASANSQLRRSSKTDLLMNNSTLYISSCTFSTAAGEILMPPRLIIMFLYRPAMASSWPPVQNHVVPSSSSYNSSVSLTKITLDKLETTSMEITSMISCNGTLGFVRRCVFLLLPVFAEST